MIRLLFFFFWLTTTSPIDVFVSESRPILFAAQNSFLEGSVF
jgi:hypothetical protein